MKMLPWSQTFEQAASDVLQGDEDLAAAYNAYIQTLDDVSMRSFVAEVSGLSVKLRKEREKVSRAQKGSLGRQGKPSNNASWRVVAGFVERWVTGRQNAPRGQCQKQVELGVPPARRPPRSFKQKLPPPRLSMMVCRWSFLTLPKKLTLSMHLGCVFVNVLLG